jgi:hypothetical protein
MAATLRPRGLTLQDITTFIQNVGGLDCLEGFSVREVFTGFITPHVNDPHKSFVDCVQPPPDSESNSLFYVMSAWGHSFLEEFLLLKEFLENSNNASVSLWYEPFVYSQNTMVKLTILNPCETAMEIRTSHLATTTDVLFIAFPLEKPAVLKQWWSVYELCWLIKASTASPRRRRLSIMLLTNNREKERVFNDFLRLNHFEKWKQFIQSTYQSAYEKHHKLAQNFFQASHHSSTVLLNDCLWSLFLSWLSAPQGDPFAHQKTRESFLWEFCYARVGLMGNPSDGFQGKTLSFLMKNFSAMVIIKENDENRNGVEILEKSCYDPAEQLLQLNSSVSIYFRVIIYPFAYSFNNINRVMVREEQNYCKQLVKHFSLSVKGISLIWKRREAGKGTERVLL